MWDRMPKLRLLISVLIYTLMLGGSYTGYWMVQRPDFLPVQQIEVSKQLQHVKAVDVLSVVHREMRGNFFTVDIAHLRKMLEQLPWVRRVDIQRSFPDRLTVNIEEFSAHARWNQGMLVSPDGETFWVPDAKAQALPQFTGPEGTEKAVVEKYAEFNQELEKIHLQIKQINLSSRRAWQVHLNNDIVLELGRENMKLRLARFVTAYPEHFAGARNMIKQADLRYRSGFAVQW